MTYRKTIVCLANSRKVAGRCVAGKTIESNQWIRPVSARPNGELSEEDRRFSDGNDPKLLDILSIPLTAWAPHGCQTENHIIDEHFYWTKEGSLDPKKLPSMLDHVDMVLWNNEAGSTYYGENDKIIEQTAAELDSSLKLIEVEDLTIHVDLEGGQFAPAKRRIRGSFCLNGCRYKLSVTDPIIEKKYFSGENGSYAVGKAIVCISLSEPFNGHCFKLIASIF